MGNPLSKIGGFFKTHGLDLLEIGVSAAGGGPILQTVKAIAGVPQDADEDQTVTALSADPAKLVELQKYQLDNAKEIRGMVLNAKSKADAEDTTRIVAVNATMQAELARPLGTGFFTVLLNFYKSAWRPTFGFVFTLAFGHALYTLIRIMADHPELATDLVPEVMYLLIAGAAVLGIQIKLRTDEKNAATGNAKKPLSEAISTVIRGNGT